MAHHDASQSTVSAVSGELGAYAIAERVIVRLDDRGYRNGTRPMYFLAIGLPQCVGKEAEHASDSFMSVHCGDGPNLSPLGEEMI